MLKIAIEYCRPCSYTERALSLASEIMGDETLEAQIRSIELIPGSQGRFEVTVNEELVFSKKDLGRHAEPGEVYLLIKDRSPGIPVDLR